MRQRLDIVLEARGLMPSRARGRDAVLRGTVTVNGVVARKPSQMIAESDTVAIHDPAAGYVSRAALKLIAGLEAGKIDPAGKTCLDVGASTGGFTQVLLERGAARVYAIDVGHGQFDATLAQDSRVVLREGLNARDLTADIISVPIDLLVCDVSFVSVTKVLAPALALCGADARAVILIKPQFEVGREHVGKGGIVTDEAARTAAIAGVIAFVEAQGFKLEKRQASPIAGGDGNVEEVAVFRRLS